MKSYEEMGGDATGQRIGDALFADYAEAGQQPNAGMGVWFWRCSYDCAAGMSIDAAIAKHRREWREALGLSPFPHPETPIEAPIAPREYAGNFCGVRRPGLPAVPGSSSAAPDLVLSWFYDRYDEGWREAMRDEWLDRGQLDVVLSWPDSRSGGVSPEGFRALCGELVRDGLRPCVFLLSKVFDPHQDVAGCLANIEQVLPLLLGPPRACSRICIGWELGLDQWLLPAQVQEITDAVTPRCVAAGIKTYVHFQQGYPHLSAHPSGTFASYWNVNIGKLTGLLHQADLNWSQTALQEKLHDVLDRFSGTGFTAPDSGFGHPWDCIAFEITASKQFNGGMSEADGNDWGRVALATAATSGPLGLVRVMGSGNGF